MAHVLVRHTVEDFGKWKAVFDGDAVRRRAAGCTSSDVYRDVDNPNAITVVLGFGSQDQAQVFANDPVLAETMKSAGVVGRPDMRFVNAVA